MAFVTSATINAMNTIGVSRNQGSSEQNRRFLSWTRWLRVAGS